MLQDGGGNDLSHAAFDLAGGLFLQIYVVGDRVEFFRSIRLRFVGYDGLDDPLNYDVGESAIRCCRVCIVVNGEAKMSAGILARTLNDTAACTDQLDERKRQIGKSFRVSGLSPSQKGRKCREIRLGRQRFAVLGCNSNDAVPTLRCFDDAAKRGDIFAFEKLRHLDNSSRS